MESSTLPKPAALIRRLDAALTRYLPQARAGDVHATHQARVASRRLREALPVLAAGLKGLKAGRTRRQVRRLTRALGSVRELDVSVGLAEELTRVEHLPRPAVEDVRALVISLRSKGREEMAASLDRVDVAKLHRRLGRVVAALAENRTEPWRERLGERIVVRTRALAGALDAAGQMYAPEQLHRVRIAGKQLRYALELAADTGASGAAAHVRSLKRMQDILGRLHDLQVLGAHVTAVQAAPNAPVVAAPEDLARVAMHVEADCRTQHARFVAAIPRVRELCAAVTTDIVPALALAPARRPPIKMRLPRTAVRAAGSRR